MSKIKGAELKLSEKLVSKANYGLVAFRAGDVSLGRQYYNEAIEGFRKDGAFEYAARAKMYLAREAMRSNLGDWPALLEDAKKSMEKHKDSAAFSTLKIIEQLAPMAKAAATDQSRNQNRATQVRDGLRVKFDFGD